MGQELFNDIQFDRGKRSPLLTLENTLLKFAEPFALAYWGVPSLF